ncbi:RNA polymerase II transcription factor B subunit 3 [Zancudomyces culisetae]|uniref:RNA polymerase II transcription factor B subunit 3 n=1 Tax=Zancudomyces culisetae TaxID=1213189 RepID=A0A1R1PJS8_ZANCU|nr:RNA polymerase II transcription factor B subunit 3 [Zancudomyces culisetae]|eukprot:OMH81173.1 RNA polymerase II transcription factor B subunit 3 [Zancudomyces culisetae]
MCSACIERLYSMGPAPCPIPGCNQILRRANFYQQIFEDLTVEREIRVRQRLSRIFNKQQREFASLLDYNNYLEFVEDITFKLVNNIDSQETELMLAKYMNENKTSIQHNLNLQVLFLVIFLTFLFFKRKKKKETLIIMLNRENKLYTLKQQQIYAAKNKSKSEYLNLLHSEKESKKKAKLDLINQLANSDKDAKDILLENAASSLRKSAASSSHTTQGRVSTGISGAGGYFNPLAKSTTSASAFASNSDDENVEVDPFLHCYNKPKYIDSIKPHYVDGNPAIKPAFSNNALAGGFSLNMHYRYLIEAAMSGIDLPPKSNALKK